VRGGSPATYFSLNPSGLSGFTQKPVPESRSADSILGPLRWLTNKMIGVALRIQNYSATTAGPTAPCHFPTVCIFYSKIAAFAQALVEQIFANLRLAPAMVQLWPSLCMWHSPPRPVPPSFGILEGIAVSQASGLLLKSFQGRTFFLHFGLGLLQSPGSLADSSHHSLYG
jgi:hypothetical protein